MQKKLLAKDKLTFEEAIKLASAMEMAEKDTESFSQTVNKVKDSRHNVRSSSAQATSGQKNPSKPGSQKFGQKTGHKPCYRCGENHNPQDCKFKNSKCYNCGKIGHVKRACYSGQQKQTNLVEQNQDSHSESESDNELGLYSVYSSTDGKSKGYKVPSTVNKQQVTFELDTGSACTIISKGTYRELLSNCSLIPASVRLRSYTGERIELVGECNIEVTLPCEDSETKTLKLVVAKGSRPNLLGRDWLSEVRLP